MFDQEDDKRYLVRLACLSLRKIGYNNHADTSSLSIIESLSEVAHTQITSYSICHYVQVVERE